MVHLRYQDKSVNPPTFPYSSSSFTTSSIRTYNIIDAKTFTQLQQTMLPLQGQIPVLSTNDLLQKVWASISTIVKIQGEIKQLSLQLRAVTQEVDDVLITLRAGTMIQDEETSADAKHLAKYIVLAPCPL